MNASADLRELAHDCRNGDRRAASRLISILESADSETAGKLSEYTARMPLPRQVIGITGPPGAGKSTLLDYAVNLYRKQNVKVGVLAVDPSSPFTGGALLGDRIRMSSLRNDTGVFIRSMGSRGATGGVAIAVSDAMRVLASAGFEIIFLETVGAGQTETEIVNLADTICVVQVPGLGDDVQLMKMGVLEIADVFVVNKGDKPGAQELKLQIEQALQSAGETSRAMRQLGSGFAAKYSGSKWTPPVLVVSALNRSGGDELIQIFEQHLQYLAQPQLNMALARHRFQRELAWRAGVIYQRQLAEELSPGGRLAMLVDRCIGGEISMEHAILKLLPGDGTHKE